MQMMATKCSLQNVRVLIIEDDDSVSDLVAGLLRGLGYMVKQCFDGLSGLKMAQAESFNLVLLDVLLPKMDGFEVLSKLRRRSDIPVIMLTAKGAEQDRICGFKTGADDYLPKPFNIDELTLRIEAVMRRARLASMSQIPKKESTYLTFDSLTLCLKQNHVEYLGTQIELTNMEMRLLALFIEHREQLLSKPYLYQELMARPYSRDERSLDVHVSKLRRKLKAAGFNAERIQTMHGQGYCLK